MFYRSAADAIDSRRESRRTLIETRKAEVISKIPQIAQLEKNLSETGIRLLSAVASETLSPETAVEKIMSENRFCCGEIKRLLTDFGYPADYLDPPYFCASCSDTGYDADGNICSCLKAELTERALSGANLTKHMSGQTFENFDLAYYDNSVTENGVGARDNAKSIFNTALRFAETFDYNDTNLLFYGKSGLGKTFLSSAIASELAKRGKDVLYISANSLFPTLEELHFGRGDEKDKYIARKALDADLLILDDLGAEFITQFTVSELFRIMNMRLLSAKKMVFSTNLSLAEIVTSYSERIVSRIIGSFETLRFFGEDIRQKKKYE